MAALYIIVEVPHIPAPMSQIPGAARSFPCCHTMVPAPAWWIHTMLRNLYFNIRNNCIHQLSSCEKIFFIKSTAILKCLFHYPTNYYKNRVHISTQTFLSVFVINFLSCEYIVFTCKSFNIQIKAYRYMSVYHVIITITIH